MLPERSSPGLASTWNFFRHFDLKLANHPVMLDLFPDRPHENGHYASAIRSRNKAVTLRLHL